MIRGDLDRARRAYRQAMAGRPDAEAYAGLGSVCLVEGRFEEAIHFYTRAVQLKPDFASAHYNLGSACFGNGNLSGALRSFERTLVLEPGFALASVGCASIHFLRGEPLRGWDLYERRFALTGGRATVPGAAPWEGQPLRHKRILAWAEQGFGDSIQFMRYAVYLKEMGAHVVVQVPPRLERLCRSIEPWATVVTRIEDAPPCDYECPFMSLPRYCGDGLPYYPGFPYLRPPGGDRAGGHSVRFIRGAFPRRAGVERISPAQPEPASITGVTGFRSLVFALAR